MIKILNPNCPANLFLRYKGKRLNFINEEPSLLKVKIEYNKCFDFAKEPIAIKVRIADATDIYIGVLNRKVYKLNENKQWVQDEASFLMHNDIIVDKKVIYITGTIINIINLNGENIEDSYKFRLFVTVNCSRLFEYIDNEAENLVIENFR